MTNFSLSSSLSFFHSTRRVARAGRSLVVARWCEVGKSADYNSEWWEESPRGSAQPTPLTEGKSSGGTTRRRREEERLRRWRGPDWDMSYLSHTNSRFTHSHIDKHCKKYSALLYVLVGYTCGYRESRRRCVSFPAESSVARRSERTN